MKPIASHSSATPFFWKGITIFQDERVHKVGTDALLLAEWIPTVIEPPHLILDVGTGTGILALHMASVFPGSEISAIDQHETAIELASLNVINASLEDRIRVFASGLSVFATEAKEKYNLIISNPPFYNHQLMPVSGTNLTAKHTPDSPRTWIEALDSLIERDGHICLVIPGWRSFEWIREANNFGFYCSHRLDVYSFPVDQQPLRSLLHFSHELIKPDQQKIYMYAEGKNYSSEYRKRMGI
jgi:tRNA1Val (adenine37-N6)-methyltransferase